MTIEAVYFDGGQRFTISIPQSLIPPRKSTTEPSKRKSKRPFFLFAIGTIVLFHLITSSSGASKAIRGLSKPRESSNNAKKIKTWRSEVKLACQRAKTEEDMTTIKNLARKAFPLSGLGLEQKIIDPDYLPGNHIHRCPYVFIDLGSGVGNSVMDFIDSGLMGCQVPRKHAKTLKQHNFRPFHLHVDGSLRESAKRGKDGINETFTSWVKERIGSFDSSIGPEDYCVYGVEGNPLLKSKLKSLENNIARMDPTPLQHVHFLTRTVAAGEPGHPIFIDHAHKKDNSPGSSIFFNHAHIRESREIFGEIVEYKVDTKSLSVLMKESLSHYNDESEKTFVNRNHLIINIDVEGSEFDILNETKNSLCDFALKGNIVDVFVQYHSPELLGIETAAMLQYIHEIRPYLERECGNTLTLYETNTYFLSSDS